MHEIDQEADVVDGRLGQDSVSEVEDMAGASFRLGEDPASLRFDLSRWTEQDCRVEVALNRDIMPEPFPG